MKKIMKPVAAVLIMSLLFSLFSLSAFAANKTGVVTVDGLRVRNKPTTSGSTVITTLSSGTVVNINSVTDGQEAVSGGGTKWYNITYGSYIGYVYGMYIKENVDSAYDPDFEKKLLNFPEDYREPLRTIHKTYPNWVFVPDNLTVSLDTAIDYEYSKSKLTSTKKWVELSFGEEWRDERVDINNSAHIKESRWTYASRAAIAFFMDIRNALKVKNTKNAYPNIFTFLEQSYNPATQTAEGLRSVISGTFLAKGYGGDADAYIKDIMAAASESGVSPYVIAGTIRIEQGVNGTSSLISGKYTGYTGYYNFFNYGAYEHDGRGIVENGLIYAKNKGWNSRRASIIGGAKLYADGYISKGQDTYYYMDFNVKSGGTHQYAASLYDQCVKAVSMRSVYTSNTDSVCSFKIPVYSSVPAKVSPVPTIHTCEGQLSGVMKATCSSEGYTGDTYCKICGKLLITGTVTPRLEHTYGDWVIDTPAAYNTKGTAHRNCTVCACSETYQIPPYSQKLPGDINGDGSLNNKDLARLFQYLSEWDVYVNTSALDTNFDGKVDNKDLSRLFQYLSEWDVPIF